MPLKWNNIDFVFRKLRLKLLPDGSLAQVDKSRPAVNHAARSIRSAPVLVVTFVLWLFSFFAPSPRWRH